MFDRIFDIYRPGLLDGDGDGDTGDAVTVMMTMSWGFALMMIEEEDRWDRSTQYSGWAQIPCSFPTLWSAPA